MSHPELDVLLRVFDQAYGRKAWHGPNLRGSIRRLDSEEASFRPAKERHSIVEVVLHAAYWKYVVRRRLLGLKRGSFSLKGSNWFPRPKGVTPAEWQGVVGMLDEEHEALRDVIVRLDPRTLMEKPPSSKVTNTMLIEGIACHDVYHAGQIQILKALQKSRP